MKKNENTNLIKLYSLFGLKLLCFCVGSFLTVETLFGPQVLPNSISGVVSVLSFVYVSSILIYDLIPHRIKNRENYKSKIIEPHRYKLLKVTRFLFSTKTQKDTFEQTMADWDLEIYENLKANKDAKLFMMHLRNSYYFLAAMIQKSPLGSLIEFVIKIAKQ